MIKYLSLVLIILPSFLSAQSVPSVLDKLNAGERLSLEWVHQQYALDDGSEAGDYPLFPDQMKEGEREAFVGLILEKETCPESSCLINVWVDYVSTVEFPDRPTYDPVADIFKANTPPTALLYPKINDTRYVSEEFSHSNFSLGNLNQIPALVDIQEGIQDPNWVVDNMAVSMLPNSFSQFYLQQFLEKLWQMEWPEKEYYQIARKEEIHDKLSIHFWKPIHPPRKTIITGQISNPRVPSVDIEGFLQGSHKRIWGQGRLNLKETNSFRIETKLDDPTLVTLSHDANGLALYVEPGDSLHIHIDANAFYRNVDITGDQIISNQFLLDFYHEVRGDTVFSGLDRHLLQQSQVEFLEKTQRKEQKELNYLEDYPQLLSPEFKSHFERGIRLHFASSLWYNATWFHSKRDAAIHPDYIAYCQSLSKYFYRLPKNKVYDFDIDQYLSFQSLLLQGAYTRRGLLSREVKTFQLAKILLSTKNAFRYGRFLLTFGGSSGKFLSLESVYEELKVGLTDETDLLEIEDFKKPDLTFAAPKMISALMSSKRVPKWSFDDLNGEVVSSADFEGDYYLLHIGVFEHLDAARQDLYSIKEELGIDLAMISLVTENTSLDKGKRYDESVLFVSAPEMQILRDSFFITNTGNNYYLIDSNGVVAASPIDLSSFHKLKSALSSFSNTTQQKRWKASPIFWRNLGLTSLFLLILSGIYIQRKRILARQEQQRRQVLELELKGIRAQMNPHFLFNSLSSIQNLIRKKDDVNADRYLTQFAELVRKILRNSEQEYITVEEEIAAIKQYCSLEALRTPFEFDIEIDSEIDVYNTYIPGMLVQPLVENAILHGLMPKKENRHLSIKITKNPQGLSCEITDNGVGLNQAKMHKQSHQAHKQSFGISLIRQRLKLLMATEDEHHLKITDRSEMDNQKTGTLVQLLIPTER